MTAERPAQWEFLQTRAIKWKWRQVGDAGVVLGESPEFALLAHCMRDAERNGFVADDHVLNCELWNTPTLGERRVWDTLSPPGKESDDE